MNSKLDIICKWNTVLIQSQALANISDRGGKIVSITALAI